MVKFGELTATFAGTVAWTGPATLKVGRKSSLTLTNKKTVALTVTVQIQQTMLRDHGWGGIIERGSEWKVENVTYDGPRIKVIGPGRSQSFKGSVTEKTVYFGQDEKYEKRPIVTYVGRETEDEGETDEITNDADTDPPDPIIEELGDNLGPFDEYTDPGDVVDNDTSGTLGGRKGTIILLLIVVLIAAGAGWAARGMAMRKMLGF